MLSCSPLQGSSYGAYNSVTVMIIVVVPLVVFIIIAVYTACLRGHEYGNLFYYLIDTLFHFEPIEDEKSKEGQDNENKSSAVAIPRHRKSLKFYEHIINSNRRRTVMLLFISVFTITSSLAVFFEGVFLANEFLKPNSNCPYDYDTLDCYGYQKRLDPYPNCYFQCTPGQQTPDSSAFFGEATCYRWVIQDITVFDVFGQIDRCYKDYSYGIRLINRMGTINGQWYDIYDVLQHKTLASLISDDSSFNAI
ncbi:unnamed protein product [Adineta steineri]|uniref:Uncharacterized protein n=1 Tax=Adineta steineri TaxID=433720 RepID=A0A815V930_9BILA|nr:unnamed protein product [Adineta steineri]CAF1527241.1 unnamed protein product [Adineta steineri]CAF1527566.1 unnamed protein product [Adineta steineri]